MTHESGTPLKFRAILKKEIPLWVEEGIITQEEAQRLVTRYRLDELGREMPHLLATAVFMIGSLLIGGGIIAFVAAHWEGIPIPGKVALLLGGLLGLYGVGYRLWQKPSWSRLGHALVFCGCLAFGANIGLMAQIFHVHSPWYNGFGAWALGSVALAWAVQSPIIGWIPLVTSFIWFIGFMASYRQVVALYPFLLAVALLPLAMRTRSRSFYVLTFVGIIEAMGIGAWWNGDSNRAALLALVSGGFLAWAVGAFQRVTGRGEKFATSSAVLGSVVLALSTYGWSFHGIPWDGLQELLWVFPVGAAVIGGVGLAAAAWMREAPGGLGRFIAGGIGTAAALLWGSAFLGNPEGRGPQEILRIGVVHAAALVLAAVAVASGWAAERRSHFWSGVLFLLLVIISRFFEYETHLLVKAAVFTACGLAVFWAGIRYERHLHRREAARAFGE
jgi:uncharacterized membrane protein